LQYLIYPPCIECDGFRGATVNRTSSKFAVRHRCALCLSFPSGPTNSQMQPSRGTMLIRLKRTAIHRMPRWPTHERLTRSGGHLRPHL